MKERWLHTNHDRIYTPYIVLLSSDLFEFEQYANVMGIEKDLGMSGNDFDWLATGFFIAYTLAELPQGIYFSSPFVVVKILFQYRTNSLPFLPIHRPFDTKTASGKGARRECLLLGSASLLYFRHEELRRDTCSTHPVRRTGSCYMYIYSPIHETFMEIY